MKIDSGTALPLSVGVSEKICGLATCALRLIFAVLLVGCAPELTVRTQESASLPRPDQVLVNDFAGTPADIRLDRGLGSVATRYIEGTDPSRERIYLENALAKILASNLAVELRMRGIEAFHGDAALISGQSALVIEGRFLTIDEGNGTLRTLIGFGLGAAAVRTQVEVVYRAGKNTQLLAEAELATKNILHPGFAPIVGIGGGAGSLLAGATVAGITTISSERFFTTVEADTKRIAAKLADWVAEYYRRQGWSGP